MIEVCLLSEAGIRRDGRPVPLQPRRMLLLAYLLVEGRGRAVRRDQLVTLFWPDADSERGRNALRQSIFALRTSLGADVIVASGSAEVLVHEAEVRCDAWALLDAVDAADHPTVDRLYRGEFLGAGAYGADTPELERWLEESRARFRRLTTMAVRALAERPLLPVAERRRYVERWSALVPYDETAAMRLVEILLAVGDRPAAVVAYRAFAARLRADLEIEPSATFDQIASGARGGEGAAVAASPPTTSTSSAGSASVVHPSAAPRPRVPARRRWVLAPVALLVLLLGTLSMRRASDASLVEIEAFVATPGAPDVQREAVGAAERMRGALASVAGVSVARGTGGAGGMGSVFHRRAPGTVVSGGVERLDAGRWRMWATVHAVESDMLLQRAEAEGAVRDSVLSAVIDRVSAVVATRLDMTLHWGKTLHRPTSLTALEQYQSAFEAVRMGDAAAGIARFRAAWGSDTAFVFAGIMAATNALAIDAFALGDSLLLALTPFEPGMLPLERQQMLRARALARSDVQGTLAAARAIAALEPTAPFLLAQYGQDAYLAGRPEEALAALDAFDARTGGATPDPDRATIRASALHSLGRFRDELRVVDATIAGQPTEPHFATARIAPLAAMGARDTLALMLAALAARDDGRDVGRLYRGAGLELRVHGHAAAADWALAQGVAWLAAHPVDVAAPAARQVARQLAAAELLLDAGRTGEARAVVERLTARGSPSLTVGQQSALLNLRGVLAAREGRPVEARALADSLMLLAGRGRNGVETYRRSRILAVLGDADGAIALLEQAMLEGFVTRRELHVDPAFAQLRTDARFRHIVAPRR